MVLGFVHTQKKVVKQEMSFEEYLVTVVVHVAS
jgi:hypothetical protein